MKAFFAAIGVFAGVLVLGFVMNFYGLLSTNFFAPKYRAIENKVWKESEQYNDGMVRDLENLRTQYIASTPAQQEMLKATILHRFSVYDEQRLTPELQRFYKSLKGEQL